MQVNDIAKATHGVFLVKPQIQDVEVVGITWDSREVEPGFTFLCFVGERTDGHDFVEAVVAAGASVVIVTRDPGANALAAAKAACVCVLQVVDAPRALVDIARIWRLRLSGRVIGLTGSSGKTTTKGLVREVLSSKLSVVATRANQNNEIGVPRTLLAADVDTQAVVVEMGMRGLGQIAELCEYVRPTWGLVTNVGEAHIELLGSRENIARAKGELLRALPYDGVAFVNAADKYSLYALRSSGAIDNGTDIVMFDGSNAPAERKRAMREAFGKARWVWAENIELDSAGCPTFDLCSLGFDDDGRVSCSLRLSGLHNVSNAVSAAAVGLCFDIDLATIARALAAAQSESGRQETLRARNGALVINDAYNANPDSMRAALATFSAMDVAGRRIAVLGDMNELGQTAKEAHERAGAQCAEVGLSRLVCVGELARDIAAGAREAGFAADKVECVATAPEAAELIEKILEPDDVLLVKASHAIGLESVVEGLV